MKLYKIWWKIKYRILHLLGYHIQTIGTDKCLYCDKKVI